MLKIKIIVICIIALSLSLSSCLNFCRNTNGVLRPKKIKFKLEKEQNSKSSLIDVLCIYELYSSWLGDYNFDSKRKDDYVIMKNYRYYDGALANFKTFLRFYNNGNLSYFHVEGEPILSKEIFNPDNGIIGVYSFESNEILMEEFSFRGHEGGYFKSKARVKGDTIHLIGELSGFYSGNHKIFIRREVSKEYLDWKSDW